MESVEYRIKKILLQQGSPEMKANEVCKFMTWNKQKLISQINEHGNSRKATEEIVSNMWG